MQIELKIIKISKSKIQQMDYIGIPKNPNAEVLGWVNMDKKRWVIVKSIGSFYRAEFITKIEKEEYPAKLSVEKNRIGGRTGIFFLEFEYNNKRFYTN
jgi:hypothetical protein